MRPRGGRGARAALLAAAVALLLPGTSPAQEGGVALVYVGDGSSVPLQSWSFSYEYATWPKGESSLSGTISRKETKTLLLGKKEYRAAESTLEVGYEESLRPDPDDGTKVVHVKVVRKLAFIGTGGRQELKIEAPARDALVSQASSGSLFMARGLDFQGQTVTGTPRSFCLLSFTSLVECGTHPGEQIVKIEFSK